MHRAHGKSIFYSDIILNKSLQPLANALMSNYLEGIYNNGIHSLLKKEKSYKGITELN